MARLIIAAATLGLLVLVSAPQWSSRGVDLNHRLFLPLGLLVILLFTMDRLICCLRLAQVRNGHKRQGLSREWWGPLLCLALLSGALVYPWPMLVRFHISRPALMATVRSVQQSGRGTLEPQVIGLYYVRAVRLRNDGSVFFQLGAGVGGWRDYSGSGFLYSVPGAVRPRGRLLGGQQGTWSAHALLGW